MNKKLILIAGGIALAVGVGIVACSPQLSISNEDKALIERYKQADETCKDHDPELEETWKSCGVRDYLLETIVSHGLCYGDENQAEYEKTWKYCGK
jgi:hypothetical protein